MDPPWALGNQTKPDLLVPTNNSIFNSVCLFLAQDRQGGRFLPLGPPTARAMDGQMRPNAAPEVIIPLHPPPGERLGMSGGPSGQGRPNVVAWQLGLCVRLLLQSVATLKCDPSTPPAHVM